MTMGMVDLIQGEEGDNNDNDDNDDDNDDNWNNNLLSAMLWAATGRVKTPC